MNEIIHINKSNYFNRAATYSGDQINSEHCATDKKVYNFLIFGRFLQAAALASCAAIIICSFMISPVILVGLVPSIAIGILGSRIQTPVIPGQAPIVNSQIAQSPPFIAGQPVGLKNSGANCWLNSSLQLLINAPAFRHRLEQIPPFAQFLHSYHEARANLHGVALNINTDQIQDFLSSRTAISQGDIQDDPSLFFEYLFCDQDSLYQLEVLTNRVSISHDQDAMIRLAIDTSVPNATFEQLFSSFFDYTTDEGMRRQCFFSQAPKDSLSR